MICVTLDGGLMAACAAADVGLLVGVLVFSSVLELVHAQDPSRYSLEARETHAHIAIVVTMVKAVVYLSAIAGGGGLVAVAVDCYALRVIILVGSVLAVIAFGAVALFAIRWFWR